MEQQSKDTYPKHLVRLVRAEAHHISSFRLSEAAHLPQGFGQASHLPMEDGTLVAVPHGSIEKYARHLAKEWGDENAYVMLVVTIKHCETNDPDEPPDPDKLTREFQGYFQSLPEEQRKRIKLSLTDSSDQQDSDENSTQATNC